MHAADKSLKLQEISSVFSSESPTARHATTEEMKVAAQCTKCSCYFIPERLAGVSIQDLCVSCKEMEDLQLNFCVMRYQLDQTSQENIHLHRLLDIIRKENVELRNRFTVARKGLEFYSVGKMWDGGFIANKTIKDLF